MNRISIAWIALLLAFPCCSQAQSVDSVVYKLTRYAQMIENFGNSLPQEKVYVHFDNTSYYQGDCIWFQCYVVTSGVNCPTKLSKTLYVELLNPGGETIAKQVLPVKNGRCHGSFSLTQLPFYSGFYEVRAYTKYMLNFGEDIIFSRVFPVFEKPKKAGDYSEKNIRQYNIYKYPQERKRTKKAKKVNLKFFPEGGNLVEGVASCIAFEATDAYGNPLSVSGKVIDSEKRVLALFSTVHEGRGTFTYTPVPDGKGDKAEVELKGKKYRFDLPEALPHGYTLHVDNLTSQDSVGISVQKHSDAPVATLGLAVMNGGNLFDFCLLNIRNDKPVCFSLDKTTWHPGVSRLVLFDAAGQVVADRLIFNDRKEEQLSISVKKEKERFQPFEPVKIEFSVSDAKGRPVQTPLSVSVRDGREEVEGRHSILTDLLLMSEIKGYVHRPFYYFESNDEEHRRALDHLLLVQGWRRYPWNYWAGIEPFELKYLPEQGIEVHGQVVSMVKGKPKPNVQVSSCLIKRGEEEEKRPPMVINLFDTDSVGRFAFISQVTGKWNLILSVREKGKKKDHRIILDRVFSPSPTPYMLGEMQIGIAGRDGAGEERELPADTVIANDMDFNRFMDIYEDSLSKKGIHEKYHRLKEVVVKAKKWSREKDIYDNRSKSIAYYDVASEIDDIKDRGKFIGEDIHELLINMNDNFTRTFVRGEEWLQYKGRSPLFVVNYETTRATEMDYNKYKLVRLEAIKAIYINEELSSKCRYADPRMSPMEVDEMYSCAVFIETYPDGQIPAAAGKGVRKTWLDGYSIVPEFYHPDYSILPKEEDYRRTLYWNPELVPDEAGKAEVRFYNNSRCRQLKVTAETVSAEGAVGTLNE